MYTNTHLVFGFHGCDKSVADRIINNNNQKLLPSDNKYDWLGSGIYFWENDPHRAIEFANELKKTPRTSEKIKDPAVVGAIIDLGNCLNLLNRKYIKLLQEHYSTLKKIHEEADLPMPENTKDLRQRFLDRAVIELIHNNNEDFDTVRGVFFEGEPLYPNAGFREKNHIQICVRNHDCIKGYFWPRDISLYLT